MVPAQTPHKRENKPAIEYLDFLKYQWQRLLSRKALNLLPTSGELPLQNIYMRIVRSSTLHGNSDITIYNIYSKQSIPCHYHVHEGNTTNAG